MTTALANGISARVSRSTSRILPSSSSFHCWSVIPLRLGAGCFHSSSAVLAPGPVATNIEAPFRSETAQMVVGPLLAATVPPPRPCWHGWQPVRSTS